jgi:hypothetical protein
MSLSGKPRALPPSYDPRALERMFQDIYDAMNAGLPYIRLQSLAAEPEKMIPHMIVIANGSDWDPGFGAGVYRRNGSNSAWVPLE